MHKCKIKLLYRGAILGENNSVVSSFLVEKGNISQIIGKGLDTAYDSTSERIYLSNINDPSKLNAEYFRRLSNKFRAIVIDFHDFIDPFAVEVEGYIVSNQSLADICDHGWVNKPCSLKLNESNWNRLKAELTKLTLN